MPETASPASVSEIAIWIPDAEWLSANSRLHWRPERQRKIALRNRGMFLARQTRLTVPTPCRLVVEVGLRTHGRADPDNCAPTVKCLVDGLVNAHALADDSSEHIMSTTYERGSRVTERGWRRITLKFIHEHVPA